MNELKVTVEPQSGAIMSTTVIGYYDHDPNGEIIFASDMKEKRECQLALTGLSSVEIIVVGIPPSEALITLDGHGTGFDSSIPARLTGNSHFRVRLYK